MVIIGSKKKADGRYPSLFNVRYRCRYRYIFTQVIWDCIQVALSLSQPHSSIPYLFGSWLRSFQKDLKPIIMLGVAATC